MPVAAGRFELGGRVGVGWGHAFTDELSGGPAAALAAAAAWWATDWLAATVALGGSMTIFSTTGTGEDRGKPEGLGETTVKLGAMARF